jgi:hypothetical protein
MCPSWALAELIGQKKAAVNNMSIGSTRFKIYSLGGMQNNKQADVRNFSATTQ